MLRMSATLLNEYGMVKVIYKGDFDLITQLI